MTDGCPNCANLRDAVQDAEAGAHEERLAKDAALRQAVAERKRADRLEDQLAQKHRAIEQSKAVQVCLDVWEECCYCGTGKPSAGPNGKRAALIAKALEYEEIGSQDICDGFRGVGLLPYRDKYNERSATPGPGLKRAADVAELLRITKDDGLDEARLERFRDYYRRVQSTPAERLREQWEQSRVVTDALFVELMRARTLQAGEEVREQANSRGHLFVVPDPESEEAA